MRGRAGDRRGERLRAGQCGGGHGGGHREDLLPGDLIVGRQTVELGAGRIGPDGRIDPASTNFLHQVDPTCREGILLAAPAALVEAAMRAWDESPELHAPWPLAPSWPAGLAARPARCVAGVLGSQDQWTSHAESIRRLRDLYGQDGEDCESAALMQVAVTHGVAALAVRGVCNNDLHLALPFGDRRLDEAVEEAARRAARLVIGLLDKLGKNADIL
jgi:nucleoside phosphorylase